jgi:hypothetical protein
MTTLYYILAIIPLFIEMQSLLKLKSIHQFNKNLKLKESDEWSTLEKNYSCLSLFYFVWIVLGFFTFQSPIFFLLLIAYLVSRSTLAVRFIMALLCTAIICFILVNKFNLHINFFKIIVEFLIK